MSDTDERSLAQFFFEVGYGACWAEAYIRNGEKQPFPLSDAVLQHAWDIAGVAHDDAVEFDAKEALAAVAPELFSLLAAVFADHGLVNSLAWTDRAAAAIAKATPGAQS